MPIYLSFQANCAILFCDYRKDGIGATMDTMGGHCMNAFPKRLRAAREGVNLSQNELARRLGVKRQTVGNWEAGLARPRAGMMPLLAEILNTSAAYLFGETNDPSSFYVKESPDPLEDVTRSLRSAGATEDDIQTVL